MVRGQEQTNGQGAEEPAPRQSPARPGSLVAGLRKRAHFMEKMALDPYFMPRQVQMD